MKATRRLRHVAGAAAVALSLMAGCGQRFDYVDVTQLSTPPLPVTVTSAQIRIPVGIAVQVAINAVKRNGSIDADGINVWSSDTSIVGVITSTGTTAIINGERPGRAELQVIYDGSTVARIPVEITEQ